MKRLTVGLAAVSALLLLAWPAHATDYYVAPGGNDANSGLNWGAAKATIQGGVDVALNAGDNVWVSNGTYVLAAHVTVPRAINVIGFGGRSNTIVNGNAVARGFNLTAAATVQGFTITNGAAATGAGVLMSAGTVRDCTIVKCVASSEGGGIYMSTLSCLAERCTIRDNNGGALGGGIAMEPDGNARDCLILGNTAGSWGGGGVYCRTTGSLRNSLIAGNITFSGNAPNSAGIFADDLNFVIENCTIVGNQQGGIYGREHGGANIRNCIVYFNDPLNYSGPMAMTNLCTTPLPLTGTGHVSGDPQFVNRGSGYGSSHVYGDYRLRFGSPAIDAGTTLATITNDLDGRFRPIDGWATNAPSALYDMGCYEAESRTSGAFRASFTKSSVGGIAPVDVTFTAYVAGSNQVTNVTAFVWNFGSNTTGQAGSDKRVVTNQYGAGLYYPSLIVSNSLGQVAAFTDAVPIQVGSQYAYVATNGGHVYPYDSWARASTNLQAAIDVAEVAYDTGATGATVYVGTGTYVVATRVLIRKGIRVTGVGGAARTIVQKGSVNCGLIQLAHAGAVLDGFTLTNGYAAAADPEDKGGGVYVANGTVRNCRMLGNYVSSAGGGVHLTAGLVEDCWIEGNTSANQGAGANLTGGGTIRRCTLARNVINGNAGGGIWLENGTLDQCTVIGNRGGGWGAGGVYLRHGAARNCLIAGNHSTSTLAPNTGGVFLETEGGPVGVLENCTVVGNYQGGVGLRSGHTTGNRVRNCIVYLNDPTNHTDNIGMQYTCAFPLPAGAGNLAGDPAFFSNGSGSGTNLVYGDYRLRGFSACIDAGTNLAWMPGTMDLIGTPRVLGRADLGAYESPSRGVMMLVR
jgi:hypothetical protein